MLGFVPQPSLQGILAQSLQRGNETMRVRHEQRRKDIERYYKLTATG